MKVTVPLKALALSVTSLAVTGARGEQSDMRNRAHNLNEGFTIPLSEMDGTQRQASLGSGEAAYRLSQYYYFIALDAAAGMKWLVVAAEDNEPTAEYSLGARLAEANDGFQNLRSCFWLKKAAENDVPQISRLARSELAKHGSRCEP